ncbi:hypothetical protein B0T24DRAFT_158898 [Lasiosphaeria ovina]|uniref:Uncharacterized protein n=1 Tax=Lasiosphaeria ovina TaxID=92902 RepID=A0AAE0ND29_9PEZI|nr:hypothetical protein B0T24DRAFT_158898 [Lasiosphaeria ovina]
MPAENTTSSSAFAILSIHKNDSLRFLQFPDDIHANIQPVILATWPLGIQSSGPYAESYQYKLKGKPFGWANEQEVVGGFRVMRNVLAFLHEQSWQLVTPLVCSRKRGAKDTLIFRRRPLDAGPPVPMDWLAVALMGSDKLRVVYDAKDVKLSGGADSDHDHLGVLISGLKKALEAMDCFQKGDWSYDSFEFKLKGRPWLSQGEDVVKSRLLLLRIVETLDSSGWQSCCSVLQRTGNDDFRMADTWYFMRPKTQAGGGNETASLPRPGAA